MTKSGADACRQAASLFRRFAPYEDVAPYGLAQTHFPNGSIAFQDLARKCPHGEPRSEISTSSKLADFAKQMEAFSRQGKLELLALGKLAQGDALFVQPHADPMTHSAVSILSSRKITNLSLAFL